MAASSPAASQRDGAFGCPDVQLGFAQNCEAWKLVSRFFPSKIGGRPAWLELEKLPPPEALLCNLCGAPCVLVCQLYAPVDGIDSCFHRTVYVFVCKSPACSKQDQGGVVALRSQLPLVNRFYPDKPLDEVPVMVPDQHSAEHFVKLCTVCGCLGPKQCSGCKRVSYCSKKHQAVDWKFGHKEKCRVDGTSGAGSSRFLLPESELVIEDEPDDEKKPERSDSEKMEEFNSLVKEKKIESLPDADVSELDRMAEGSGEDPVFARFRRQVAREPEQVVRYWRGGEPLWVSSRPTPQPDQVPHCPSCGAPRHFEFQILPQMLNHLDLDTVSDSVDWGTLAVYTCSASCPPPQPDVTGYQTEFVWKQHM